MVQNTVTGRKRDRALERLVRHSVLPEFARRRPGRVLLMTPDPERFPRLGDWNIVAISRKGSSGRGPVVCETGQLPFRDGSFDIVLLHHVAIDGREPELHEAWRVLCSGGDIFVLGAGSYGLRGLVNAKRSNLPRIRVLQVCQQLRRRAFEVEQCAACGLAGVPLYWERWWQRPALPLADTLVIHGRHRPLRPIINPLRFGRTQAVGVRRTATESFLREAE
jgi:SAM-dependent methyltransferase